jgi:hypothetical protein
MGVVLVALVQAALQKNTIVFLLQRSEELSDRFRVSWFYVSIRERWRSMTVLYVVKFLQIIV